MSNILDALVTASQGSDLPLTLAGDGVSAGPIHDTFGVSRASSVVVNDGVGTLVFGPNTPNNELGTRVIGCAKLLDGSIGGQTRSFH